CTFNGPQYCLLPGSIGNPNSIKGEPGNFECHDQEMKKCHHSSKSTLQNENFSLKGLGVHIEYIEGDHVRSGLLEPAASC
ncbi:hypothetical protein N9D38_12105, partial [Rubripirellula sp.]|nr:hypothetical protein [Rubripirellula sp.]